MWSLYQKDKFLKPLQFSNGKTQEDITKEVINAIKEGNRIILIRGMCGSGKSAMALNIAKEVGKTAIVVPGKNLQRQYKKDYEGDKYVLKNNKERIKISVITGRKNHVCKFLEDNKNAIPKFESNSRLSDLFDMRRDDVTRMIGNDLSAENRNIPCKIDISEKNWRRIREYIKQNKDVNPADYEDIENVKRPTVAGACPYWCPVLPEKYDYKKDSPKKKSFIGLNNTKFTIYPRKSGCNFYEQFNSYIDSDVLVFNSHKYKLETALNRKPLTDLDIIDECDEFLDSFSNSKMINIDRLQNSLISIVGVSEKAQDEMQGISEKIREIKRSMRIREAAVNGEILPVKDTEIYDLLKLFLKASELIYEIDESNYLCDVQETAWIFDGFFDETHVIFDKKDENILANLVTTNLAKKFKEMVDKNKVFVLMSGTLHSEEVLRDIFGLDNFKIIEAETVQPGNLEIMRTGLEFDCKYPINDRRRYLLALDLCMGRAKKPVLVHINSFTDLPSKEEMEKYHLDNLISRDELKNMQDQDKDGELVNQFKNKEIDVLFSTRASRGMDFPGDECNSIIFTKYPNPDVKDAFWKILQKNKPQHYWKFYKDKAKRELLQRVYRGLRFKEDHVYLLSPDERVLKAMEK